MLVPWQLLWPPSGGPLVDKLLERMEGVQQCWKLQVQVQHKTVFDQHKVLS